MERASYTSTHGPRPRPTRLLPLRDFSRQQSSATPFDSTHPSYTLRTSSQTSQLRRASPGRCTPGHGEVTMLTYRSQQTLPTRQSKPLGRRLANPTQTPRRPPGPLPTLKSCEEGWATRDEVPPLAADKATAASAASAAALHNTFETFETPDDEAYAARHGLPDLFSSLVRDLSHADAELVGNGRTWVCAWFEAQLAAATTTTTAEVEPVPSRTTANAPCKDAANPPQIQQQQQQLQPDILLTNVVAPMQTPPRAHRPRVPPRACGVAVPAAVNPCDTSTTSITSSGEKGTKLPTMSYTEAIASHGEAVHVHQRGSIESVAADQASNQL